MQQSELHSATISIYTQSNQILDQLPFSELAVCSVSIIHLKLANVFSRLNDLIGM
jgi:hypothetical protein